MRLFLDANILFSAAWDDAAAAGLLWELASAGHCELLSSRLAIEEARRNIASKRPERMTELESLIGRVLIGREPGKASLSAAGQFGLPGKDVPILAAAIAQAADILVTGDRSAGRRNPRFVLARRSRSGAKGHLID